VRAAHVRRTYGYKYGYLYPNMPIFTYLYPIFGYFMALEDPAKWLDFRLPCFFAFCGTIEGVVEL